MPRPVFKTGLAAIAVAGEFDSLPPPPNHGVRQSSSWQYQDLTTHRRRMLHAFEVEDSLLVEGEDIRVLLQGRQIDIRQHIPILPEQGKIVVVVRLQIPEGERCWLVAVNHDK